MNLHKLAYFSFERKTKQKQKMKAKRIKKKENTNRDTLVQSNGSVRHCISKNILSPNVLILL